MCEYTATVVEVEIKTKENFNDKVVLVHNKHMHEVVGMHSFIVMTGVCRWCHGGTVFGETQWQ